MMDFWKRKINFKEPEVVKATLVSALFIIFLILIDFRAVFLSNIESVRSLFLALIGGLIGLLGVSIAGIAIALSMFTSKEIRTINDLQQNSFSEILKTFSHFAYDVIFLYYLVYRNIFAFVNRFACAINIYILCYNHSNKLLFFIYSFLWMGST